MPSERLRKMLLYFWFKNFTKRREGRSCGREYNDCLEKLQYLKNNFSLSCVWLTGKLTMMHCSFAGNVKKKERKKTVLLTSSITDLNPLCVRIQLNLTQCDHQNPVWCYEVVQVSVFIHLSIHVSERDVTADWKQTFLAEINLLDIVS